MTRTPSAATTGDLFDPQLAAPKYRRRPRRAPVPLRHALLVAGAVAALLWGAWVTKSVLAARAHPPAFAAVRLQPLVAEFVAAQVRSGSPEAEVARDTQAFMARLDAELQAHGRAGTTVLVAEAVLSKNVPDITPDIRRAVLAGASQPQPQFSATRGAVAPAGAAAPAGGGHVDAR